MTAPSVFDQLRTAVRARGLRATPARIAVLGLLRTVKTPLTHAEVAEQLEGQGWDRATIFRNLTDMAEAGLVRRTDLGDHMWRFESVDGAAGNHSAAAHPHFLCTECGDVACLPELRFSMTRTKSEAPRAIRSNKVEVQVRGVCDDCA
jgi:Fur family transcriptional regulator, ferric uptake regulator